MGWSDWKPFSSGGSLPIYLGSGNTFDLTGYSGWKNFTEDNFIVSTNKISTCLMLDTYANAATSSKSKVGSEDITKTYNATTGTLTITPTLISAPQIAVSTGGNAVATANAYATPEYEVWLVTEPFGDNVEKYKIYFTSDGKGTTGGTSFQIKAYLNNYTNNYSKLTAEDIIVDFFNSEDVQLYGATYYTAVDVAYNPETSLITLGLSNSTSQTGHGFYTSSATFNVYILRRDFSGSGYKKITLPNANQIDIRQYTENWPELTSDNFAVEVSATAQNNTAGTFTGGQSASASYDYNYNNTTGILTINLNNGQGGSWSNGAGRITYCNLSIKHVYLFDKVKNEEIVVTKTQTFQTGWYQTGTVTVTFDFSDKVSKILGLCSMSGRSVYAGTDSITIDEDECTVTVLYTNNGSQSTNTTLDMTISIRGISK